MTATGHDVDPSRLLRRPILGAITDGLPGGDRRAAGVLTVAGRPLAIGSGGAGPPWAPDRLSHRAHQFPGITVLAGGHRPPLSRDMPLRNYVPLTLGLAVAHQSFNHRCSTMCPAMAIHESRPQECPSQAAAPSRMRPTAEGPRYEAFMPVVIFSCKGGLRPQPEYDSDSACRRPRRPDLILPSRPGPYRHPVLADERAYVHGQYRRRRLPRHRVGGAGPDRDFLRLRRRDDRSAGTGVVLRGADPGAAAGGVELHPVSRRGRTSRCT